MKTLLYKVNFILLFIIFSSSSHGEVLFFDDFESGDLSKTTNDVAWTGGSYTSVQKTQAKNGAYALEFNFVGGPDGADAWAEQRFTLGNYYRELWIQYDLYVPSNYYHRNQDNFSANNKSFIHLWTDDYSAVNGIGGGFEVWSDGTGVGNLAFHPYNPDIGHLPGDIPNAKGIETTDLGKWMNILIYIKAGSDTEGAVVRLWKNNTLHYQLLAQAGSNILFNASGNSQFNNGYLLGWANSGFAQTTKMYIDNVTISSTPITTTAPPTPSAPVLLRVQ